MEKQLIVSAQDLKVRFKTPDSTVYAVNGVSFSLAKQEVLCILGESGSGKSVTLRAILGLNPPKKTKLEGHLKVCGLDVIQASEAELNKFRGRQVSMIFQEPMTSLDPVFTVGHQIAE